MLIKLSLCGVRYKVPMEILEKSEYFKCLFEDNKTITENDELFIPRSPHIFKHILSLLIDENYIYQDKYKDELKYYLINIKEEPVEIVDMEKPDNLCQIKGCDNKRYDIAKYCNAHTCSNLMCYEKNLDIVIIVILIHNIL